MEWHLIYTLIKQIDMAGESLEARRDLMGEILTDLIAKKNSMLAESPDKADYMILDDRLKTAWEDFKELDLMYNPMLDANESYYQERQQFTVAYFSILLELKSIIEEHEIFNKNTFKAIPLPGAAHARVQEEFD
jgi:hypothetical protein